MSRQWVSPVLDRRPEPVTSGPGEGEVRGTGEWRLRFTLGSRFYDDPRLLGISIRAGGWNSVLRSQGWRCGWIDVGWLLGGLRLRWFWTDEHRDGRRR